MSMVIKRLVRISSSISLRKYIILTILALDMFQHDEEDGFRSSPHLLFQIVRRNDATSCRLPAFASQPFLHFLLLLHPLLFLSHLTRVLLGLTTSKTPSSSSFFAIKQTFSLVSNRILFVYCLLFTSTQSQQNLLPSASSRFTTSARIRKSLLQTRTSKIRRAVK